MRAAISIACWALAFCHVYASIDGERFTVAVEADASIGNGQWDATAIHFPPAPNATATREQPQPHDMVLAIGVKTSVLHGAVTRQAIRETWGHKDRIAALGVRLWFIGCPPDLSHLSATERTTALETIELEKATYQDLLTHELRCDDSFAGRVGKTIEFMHFVDALAPAFVLMTDDDVYVRLDALAELLGTLPRERLYAGDSPTEAQRDPSPPDRNPESRFFLAEDDYPMSELPPYVASSQYILSGDMAAFIALNRDDLQGLGGLDDVTMALWMLCLQVHPTFLERFQVLLPPTPCKETVVSLANVSPRAMHKIHANLAHGRAFCHGFSYHAWHNPDVGDGLTTFLEDASIQFAWDIQHDPDSMSLHIQVDVIVGDQHASVLYVPSAGAYDAVFCSQLLEVVHSQFARVVRPAFCARHRRLLEKFLSTSAPALSAKFEIARHNLARAESDEASGTTSPVFTTALSPMAVYSRVVLECLLTRLYPDHHIVLLREADLPTESPPPDLFVFSILDDPKKPVSSEAADTDPLGSGAVFVYKYGPTSRLLMVSGEAWPTYKLHPHVTLISTVHTPRHPKHVYLPYASAAFGEMVHHTPTELLSPIHPTTAPTRFCAYLYSNCQVTVRETMFDLLNVVEPVDALGRCRGTQRAPEDQFFADRYASFYIDRAVESYIGYKFVIAFENTFDAPGYMTEKIVTAFLAGAVPIYYGNSEAIERLFNPRAFINCGTFASLDACADYVHRVHTTPTEYDAMKNEPPIANTTAFLEFFSWHPSAVEMAEATGGRVARLSEELATLLKR